MHQSRRWLFALLICLGIGVVGASAAAQDAAKPDAVRNNIIGARGPLSDNQREQVENYVEFYSGLITGDQPDEIAQARQAMLEPIQRPGATAAFKDQYSAIVVNALTGSLNAPSQFKRLNVTIVLAQLYGPNGAEMLLDAAGDDSPAVRYWATTGLARMLQASAIADELSDRLRERIYRTAVELLGNDQPARVRQQLYVMLSELETTEAWSHLIDAMQRRVSAYGGQGLDAGVRAETVGTVKLLSRLRFEIVQAKNAGDQQRLVAARAMMQNLAVTSYQYLQLIAEASLGEGFDSQTLPAVLDYVRNAEKVLTSVLRAAQPKAEAPALFATFESGAQAGDYAGFAEAVVVDWRQRLTRDVGIDAQRLDMPLSATEEGGEQAHQAPGN